MTHGEVDRAPRRRDRGLVVADAGMVFDRQRGIERGGVRAHGGLVLAVGRDRQGGLGEDRLEAFLVVDQHVPRARPDEDLDSGRALRPTEFIQILGCGTYIKAVIDDTASGCKCKLVPERIDRDGLRHGVGHLQERGHPSGRARAAARAQVLLVRQPGVAEVDLVVDHAGQKVQPGGVHDVIRPRVHRSVDTRDALAFDQHRGPRQPVAQNDGGVADQRAVRRRPATRSRGFPHSRGRSRHGSRSLPGPTATPCAPHPDATSCVTWSTPGSRPPSR